MDMDTSMGTMSTALMWIYGILIVILIAFSVYLFMISRAHIKDKRNPLLSSGGVELFENRENENLQSKAMEEVFKMSQSYGSINVKAESQEQKLFNLNQQFTNLQNALTLLQIQIKTDIPLLQKDIQQFQQYLQTSN